MSGCTCTFANALYTTQKVKSGRKCICVFHQFHSIFSLHFSPLCTQTGVYINVATGRKNQTAKRDPVEREENLNLSARYLFSLVFPQKRWKTLAADDEPQHHIYYTPYTRNANEQLALLYCATAGCHNLGRNQKLLSPLFDPITAISN
jgi:hypothetical protein